MLRSAIGVLPRICAILALSVGLEVAGAAGPIVAEEWETAYARRLDWWSLQPVASPPPPPVADANWIRVPHDAFVLARLEAEGLRPAQEAEPATLVRRLALVLTGLPPAPEAVRTYAANPTPTAYAQLVEDFLASPHFGERWARHWMDVMHYSDTHGYEWDIPAKNAWRYRDYLIRAFQHDVSFQQLALEHLAGDLIPPRIDPDTGMNEALCGPMGLHMGERRHGDNADADGVSQEATANVIDTVGKAFLATTVACAQCHDHKLDAIAQRDYYALAGIFMSSRWTVRCTDATDPNRVTLEQLADLKRQIRAHLAQKWLGQRDALAAALGKASESAAATATNAPSRFPETLGELLRRPVAAAITAAEFAAERDRRIRANRENLRLVADFASAQADHGLWQWEGRGMDSGLVEEGELVVAGEGMAALEHLLPAGRWSHAWSMRLAGALRSPELYRPEPLTFSVGYGGGRKSAWGLVVDRALHSERQQWNDVAPTAWLTFTAGNFNRLAGPPDTAPRRIYFEAVTKELNSNFPPRYRLGGVTAEDEADPRSWFGVTKVYAHAPGQGPLDELDVLAPLFSAADAPHEPLGREALVERAAERILAAVARWQQRACEPGDTATLNEALREIWLPQACDEDAVLARCVDAYRATERLLVADRTLGSLADWREGADERLALRGDYNQLGAPIARGTIRFLAPFADPAPADSSGRLEFARSVAHEANPLTARVYVNRVWLHAFGEGLVRTPDDFGRLGARPDQPELLDFLTRQFMAEGWSTKKLLRALVHSATWRQSSAAGPVNAASDPTNRLWHHYPRRSLEAESLRDAMLVVAGQLDRTVGGPPIDPHRIRADPDKRLAIGPLDGGRRRSLYLKMTLMEPPRFLAQFNQPLPRVTVGKRDRTEVPEQALALLNDPFVAHLATAWAAAAVGDGASSVEQRCETMFFRALSRPPAADETQRLAEFARHAAQLRGTPHDRQLDDPAVWQDVAHALFNLQEFRHVH